METFENPVIDQEQEQTPVTPPKRPRGRQLTYTPEIAAEICDRISQGISLMEVCQSDGMPARNTVMHWVNRNLDGFAERFARARQLQWEVWADELPLIADDSRNDYMTRMSETGQVKVVNAETVNRARLRVDTRKWLLERLIPSVYGERQSVAVDVTSNGLTCADILRQRLEMRRQGQLPPSQPMNNVNVIDVAVNAATHVIGKRSDVSEANAESTSLDAQGAEIALDESASD